MDNLAKAAFLAAQEGISYGNWMAKHEGELMPEVKLPGAKICPNCGGEVIILSKYGGKRKFCSDQCTKEYHTKKWIERRKRK